MVLRRGFPLEDGLPQPNTRLLVRALATSLLALILLEMLMSILNHYDGAVHHRSNSDGNSSQRHDVGIDAL